MWRHEQAVFVSAFLDTSGLPPGHPLGRFEIVREIASGGFGTVYEGVHKHTRRRVALKVLHAHIADDDANRERFLREVRAPARVEHAAMVEVYDADVDPRGQPWVAMEWLEGQTLRDVSSTLGELLDHYIQLLDGLAAAHVAGVIHRDLKPENVFLETRADGTRRVRLLDFGLAREKGSRTVTKEGISLGTPRYMSPEQLMNARTAGPPSDVWAVGVMLYEALAGRPPFDLRVQNALVVQILTEDPAPLAAPSGLAQLVHACLVKEPAESRPAAAVMRERLVQIRAGLSAAALQRPVPLQREATTAEPKEGPTRPDRPRRPVVAAQAPVPVATLPESRPYGARVSEPQAPARSSRLWLVALGAVGLLGALGLVGAGLLWMALAADDPVESDHPPSGPAPGPLAPSYPHVPTPHPSAPNPTPMAPVAPSPAPATPSPTPSSPTPSSPTPARPRANPRPDDTSTEELAPPPPPPDAVDPLHPLRELIPPL